MYYKIPLLKVIELLIFKLSAIKTVKLSADYFENELDLNKSKCKEITLKACISLMCNTLKFEN